MKIRKLFIREKRKFPRLDSSLLLHYRVYDGADLPKDIFLTKDVSEGGLCFSSPEDFGPETILELEIRLPTKNTSLKALGKVVWSRQIEPSKYDLGISFVKIEEEDRKGLFSYLSLFEPWKETRYPPELPFRILGKDRDRINHCFSNYDLPYRDQDLPCYRPSDEPVYRNRNIG